jgi:hypothetical protein
LLLLADDEHALDKAINVPKESAPVYSLEVAA